MTYKQKMAKWSQKRKEIYNFSLANPQYSVNDIGKKYRLTGVRIHQILKREKNETTAPKR
jgi:Mor family transcriptional regulator